MGPGASNVLLVSATVRSRSQKESSRSWISRSDVQGLNSAAADSNHKRGDRVRVRDGPFASALGLFEGVADADRVAILLELLGCKVRVVLDGDLIEAAQRHDYPERSLWRLSSHPECGSMVVRPDPKSQSTDHSVCTSRKF